jgi:tellurite resistance protein
MDFLKIFKSNSDVRKSQVKNLIAVAMADGQLDSDEWELLLAISRVLGISEKEIHDIKNNPDKIEFVAPKAYDDKVQHVQDLVAVMTIDGNINQKELELCKKISLRLDILPQLVDEVVARALQPNPAAEKQK